MMDRELEQLFQEDPELLQTAQKVSDARPETKLDPRFSAVLRAQLMREAPAVLGRHSWWQRNRGRTAWLSGGLGFAASAAAIALLVVNQAHDQQTPLAFTSSLQGATAVDPNQDITVSFNQPMNQATVVSALHIEPATSVTTQWSGNTLTIVPTHHLAANVAYTVTIDHSAAQTASGQPLTNDVTVSFSTGTPANPTPNPSAPSLNAVPIASTDGDLVLIAPDASVVANGSPATGTSPSATVNAQTSSPSPSGDGLYAYPSSGGSVRLGNHAQAVAYSPDGKHVAVALQSGANSTLWLENLDGSGANKLGTITGSVVALSWSDAHTVLAATSSSVFSVDLKSNITTSASAVNGGGFTALSPDGQYAYEPGEGLLNLSTNTWQTVNTTGSVAFSADGGWIAWVDANSQAQIDVATVTGTSQKTVQLPNGLSATSDSAFAINHDGSEIAFSGTDSSGQSKLYVLTTDTSTVLATQDGAGSQLAFDPNGDHLAFAGSGSNLYVATVPTSSKPATVSAVPASATATLQQFLVAQVAHNVTALNSLSGATANAVTQTPKGLTRSNLVSATLESDGTIKAMAELTATSSTHGSSQVASETIVLTPNADGSTYLVTELTVGALQAQTAGPHVLQAESSQDATVFTITFDSDLQASSTQSSITVKGAGGRTLPVKVHYDESDRTVTVTVLGPSSLPTTLTVATSLTDVNGTHLAQPFTYSVGG